MKDPKCNKSIVKRFYVCCLVFFQFPVYGQLIAVKNGSTFSPMEPIILYDTLVIFSEYENGPSYIFSIHNIDFISSECDARYMTWAKMRRFDQKHQKGRVKLGALFFTAFGGFMYLPNYRVEKTVSKLFRDLAKYKNVNI